MDPEISNILAMVEHKTRTGFADPALLWEALQTTSAPHTANSSIIGRVIGPDGNKSMSLVGEHAVKKAVDRHFATSENRQWARLHMLSEITLARAGRDLGLIPYIQTGRLTRHRGSISARLVARTVLAIIGAVDMDTFGNVQKVEDVMAVFGLLPTRTAAV